MHEQSDVSVPTPQDKGNAPFYLMACSMVARGIAQLFYIALENDRGSILSYHDITTSVLLAFLLFQISDDKSKEGRRTRSLPIIAYVTLTLSSLPLIPLFIDAEIVLLCYALPHIATSLAAIGVLKNHRSLVFYPLACLLPVTTRDIVYQCMGLQTPLQVFALLSTLALMGAGILFIFQGTMLASPSFRLSFQSIIEKRTFRPFLIADIAFLSISVLILRSPPFYLSLTYEEIVDNSNIIFSIIALAITRALLVLPPIPGRLKDLGLPRPLAILGAIPILGTIMMVPLSLADGKRAVEDPQANEEEQALRFANENPRIGIHCIAHLLIIFTLFPVFTMGQKGGGALLASFLFYLIIAEICHRRMRNSAKHEKAYFITSIVFYTLIALTPLVFVLPAYWDSDLLSMLGETYAGMFSTDESQYENVFDLWGQIGSSGAIAPLLTSMAWCVYFTFIPILHLLNSRHEHPGSRGSTSSSSNPPAAD